MRRVFLDCDGVLADFDRGFIHAFNKHPRAAETEWGSETFWKNLQEYQRDGKGFYESLPLMLDADKLMISLLQYDPIILTGCPLGGWAEAQKQRWAAEHFPGTKMITCMSKNKRDHMQPGDILIDDWDRHKNLWEEAEGIFIHYKSAHEAILEVHRIFRQDAMIQDAIDSANSYPMPPRSVLEALGLISKQRSQSAIETDIPRQDIYLQDAARWAIETTKQALSKGKIMHGRTISYRDQSDSRWPLVSNGMLDAIQAASHYVLDDYRLRPILQTALEYFINERKPEHGDVGSDLDEPEHQGAGANQTL